MSKATQTVQTTAGLIKVVTLEEFVSEIPTVTAMNLVEQHNALLSTGSEYGTSVVPPGGNIPDEDSTYVRCAVALAEQSAHNQLLHILDQVNFVHAAGNTRDERIEDVAVRCMENFGVPTHLVQITWNSYGMFCMDDFKYKVLNPTKGATICYAPNRNLIFRTGF
jgi:hypothetical protein